MSHQTNLENYCFYKSQLKSKSKSISSPTANVYLPQVAELMRRTRMWPKWRMSCDPRLEILHKLKLRYLKANVPDAIVVVPLTLSETVAEGNKVGGPNMHKIANNKKTKKLKSQCR